MFNARSVTSFAGLAWVIAAGMATPAVAQTHLLQSSVMEPLSVTSQMEPTLVAHGRPAFRLTGLRHGYAGAYRYCYGYRPGGARSWSRVYVPRWRSVAYRPAAVWRSARSWSYPVASLRLASPRWIAPVPLVSSRISYWADHAPAWNSFSNGLTAYDPWCHVALRNDGRAPAYGPPLLEYGGWHTYGPPIVVSTCWW